MAREVNIPINAPNSASKVLAKVGEDSRRLGRTLQRSSQQAVQANNRIKLSFADMAKGATAVGAAIVAVKGITAAIGKLASTLTESTALYNTQVESVRGLGFALELSGEAAEGAVEKHKAFASQLQLAANVGDEVTLGLMKQASMLGVSEGKLQEVTKVAIGLADATGLSLKTSLLRTVEAINGSTSSLGRYVPALKSATSEEERLAAVIDVAEKGFAQSQDRVGTLQGIMTRAANSVGDLKEAFGLLLAPMKMLISQGVARFAESMQAMMVPMLDRARAAIEAIGPKLKMVGTIASALAGVVSVAWDAVANVTRRLRDAIVGMFENVAGGGASFIQIVTGIATSVIKAITMIEVGILDLPTVFEFVQAKVQLSFVEMQIGVAKFASNLPQMIKRGVLNVTIAIIRMAVSVVNVFKTMALQVARINTTMWLVIARQANVEHLKNAVSGAFTAVTDSAKKAMSNAGGSLTSGLSEHIAKLGDKKQDLNSKIGTLGSDLGDQFNAKFSDRATRLADAMKEIEVPDFKIDVGTLTGTEQGASKPINATASTLQATESRLLTRGATQDPQRQILDENKRQTKELQAISKNIAKKEIDLKPDPVEMVFVG